MDQVTLEIKRGDSKSWTLEFTVKETGYVIDITGWEIVFTAKEKETDLDSAAIIQKIITSHIDPINGKSQIVLSSIDTDHIGNFLWDIQIKKDTGEIKTILEGILSISKDITLRS